MLLKSILLGIVGVQFAAAAAIPCPTTTLDQYEAMTGGCVGENGILYEDFSFSVLVYTSAYGTVALSASGITVTPTQDGLDFSGNFSVLGGDYAFYELDYEVDPNDNINPGGVTAPPPFGVSITEYLCLGANFTSPATLITQPGTCPTNSTVTLNYGSAYSGPPIPPESVIGVQNLIFLQGSPPSGTGISGFEQDFDVVPESGTARLCLGGLVALIALGRRRVTA